MSVISNWPAMPNRISIACELLSFLGSDGGTKDDILKQLSPFSSDEGGETVGTGTTIASAVVTEMMNLQLARINAAGNLCLTEEVLHAMHAKRDWQSCLRGLLRERVTDETLCQKYKQEDVADAIAWLLAQDPFKPIAKSNQHAEMLRDQFDANDALLTSIGNDSRFQNLLYWARYLGFAEWIDLAGTDHVMPDPTRAVSEMLPAIFEERSRLSIGEFAAQLGAISNVLEGSGARETLERRSRGPAREHHHFARSTSLCLVRLELRKVVGLEKEADTETWILDLGREQRPVTSIHLAQRAKR